MKKETNFAYIDGANLHKGIADLGWKLNYRRLRVWLKEKYSVGQAYLFLGLIPEYKDLYRRLQEAGFILVFKEVVYDGNGKVKGNCDADLVVNCMRDFYEKRFSQAIIVSSDGDYASLVSFLKEKQVFRALLSPGTHCSFLLRKLNIPIVYLSTKKSILQKRSYP